MKTTHIELKSQEVICMNVLEITSFPDASITSYPSEEEARLSYTSLLTRTLGEIYQIFKSNNSNYKSYELALEVLWLTEPILNQTYDAHVRIFVVLRCIGQNYEDTSNTLDRVFNVFTNTLSVEKYEYLEIELEYFQNTIKNVNSSKTLAITREAHIENILSPTMSHCYSYDCFGIEPPANEILLNTLLKNPYSVVSFQIIPTLLTVDELNAIDKTNMTLGILTRGMHDSNGMNIVFESAKQSYSTYNYYNSNKNRPIFAFNIYIRGSHESVADISSSVRTQLQSSKSTNTQTINVDSEIISYDEDYFVLPWVLHDKLIKILSFQANSFAKEFSRLPLLITSEEAAPLVNIPIGSSKIKAGIKINSSEQSKKSYAKDVIDSGDITIGKLKSSSGKNEIGLNLEDFAKHMLIVGTPGSGKTTFSISLLDRLWKEKDIPFLVIEPAKNEYRAMLKSIEDLQVFTPGKNFLAPFVFNPFVPPRNVKLETYKSTLKTAFSAAVSMSTVLNRIFEDSINNCYSEHRWLDSYTIEDQGRIFNIADFIKSFQECFDSIGYTGDAKNIGRAGLVRLKSLSSLFDNYFSIPIEDLLSKPTVIELAAIENSDQKALLISLILISVMAYVNANYPGQGGLNNIILLEEAHVLLDANISVEQGEANPSAVAQSLLKRMLAEIRSYGVGMIIADQSPRKVSSDVIALTDIKMAFRIVENVDKHIISDSTNMTDIQIQRLSRLKRGEAFLFFNQLEEPEEIITPDYRQENDIKITISDDEVLRLSTYWRDKQLSLRPYPECNLCKYCSSKCYYSRRTLSREIAKRIYAKNFRLDSTDFMLLKNALGQITNLTKAELNNEIFSPELLTCVKVHFWRNIKYNTKIKFNEKQMENSILK